MTLFLRQVGTLVWKNILIILIRHPITTPLRCLLLPIVYGWFLSYARNFFIAPSTYGIGSPEPIVSLQQVLALDTGRDILALVNNGHSGGDIDKVLTQIGNIGTSAGKNVLYLDQEDDLLIPCRSTLRGTSNCFAALVFYSSPTEGGLWNYTLRVDGSLGAVINTKVNNNDPEIFVLPIQHAVDSAIASVDQQKTLSEVEEYSYTSITQDQRNTQIRVRYNGAIITLLGVALYIGICGILYQQVGLQAVEREAGISQLLESMMPNKARWQPQAARLIAYHLAFSIMFAPGWIIMAIILKVGVFARTSAGIVIVTHLLTGLSLASWGLFVGAFFRKAQLSGITAIILSLVLGVIAQVFDLVGNGAVIICSLLFPSMNYVWFMIYMARWESQDTATNLVQAAPENPWTVTGIVLWVLLIVQIVVYPVLAFFLERFLWGTASPHPLPADGIALELTGFSKHYYPNWFQTRIAPLFNKAKKETVLAADNLNLSIIKGQLTVLVGANGCGKSTTMNSVSGLLKPTAGTIKVDSSQGIGLCPQKNVQWPLLSVLEHVTILNRLKSRGKPSTKTDNLQLIRDCDLDRKIRAKAGSLSGGQQRKLQLAMMFTGGSQLCLVDEVSSGIDPLARRKIQEILLAERSKRTIIFTSHFLDEADIADRVVIMSKGKIRLDGTGPQIKSNGLYRVHLHHGINASSTPDFPGIDKLVRHDQTVYTLSSPAEVKNLLTKVEENGWHEYHVAGPTIEDAFLQVAEEMVPEIRVDEKASDSNSEKELTLQNGSHIGPFRQGFVLFRKRLTVFRRNFIPNTVALLVVPIAAGLVSLFIATYPGAGCSPTDAVSASDISNLTTQLQDNLDVVIGPSTKLGPDTLKLVGAALGLHNPNGSAAGTTVDGSGHSFNLANLTKSFHVVDTLDDFNSYLVQNRRNVTPGGAFFDSNQTTMAFKGNGPSVLYGFLINNIVNIINSGISISASYSTFDIPWAADQGMTLQFCVYLGLVMCMYPAFFALYPTLERLRKVRSLHYSNGVRALPLWLSYTIFDFIFVVVGSAVAIIILAAVNSAIFWSLGHLFVVFVLYGICATLLSYVVSLYAKSQLAAFAIAAAYQAVSLLLYMIAYLAVFTYSAIGKVDANLLTVHYTMSIIFPSGSLMRAFFVSLNELSVNCRAPNVYASSPAEFQAYGAPITYLLLQSLLIFGYLVWWDTGIRAALRRKYKEQKDSEADQLEPDVHDELKRVEASQDDGLKVLHLTKAFGSNVAVRDVSFGIKRGEVFALLGPNGAGKSTVVGMIRGDLQPSSGSGDILVEGVSMLNKKATARQMLGNCPQFDAMDQLTVLEHLRFYARIRGVKNVEANVQEVVRGVGLTAFKNRMGNALSGGNKRKLSLGIALMGNPAVMLLDEISSGLDVAAKRILWKTLETVVPGRSIALITHSMEEADRLCRRAGIMAQKMLAIGTTEDLRRKHGNRYHVHILLNSAPYTTKEEAERVMEWVKDTFEHADLDGKGFHGQIRFSVPIDEKTGGIARLFQRLEDSKQDLGFEYYSVAQTTLEDVFLRIVAKHNVEEENYTKAGTKGGAFRGLSRLLWFPKLSNLASK